MKLTRRAVSEVLQPCGVGVFESRHAPDFAMEWRRHTFLKLIYVRTGEGCVSLESRSYPFRDRDIIVVPAGVRNRLIDSPNRMVSLYALCLARELLAFDKTLERRLGQGIRRGDEYLANQAERHLRRLLFQQKHAPEHAGLANPATRSILRTTRRSSVAAS